MKIFLISIFTSLLFSVTVFGQETKVKTLTPKKFERKMDKKSVVILDVRTEAEYNEGHLKDAVLMDVQKDNFKQKVASLDKSKTYLVYCKSGRRSEKALHIFAENGFTRAYHLKGGYLNWKGEKVK